ncbi:MAG: AraC family transcriptional regulator, partial [Hungatella sp.]
EIIMPCSNVYAVEIGGVHTDLKEGDIFIFPPGELHSLTAPRSGERLIMQFDYSLICNLIGMDSLIHLLQPFKIIEKSEKPELNFKLRSYLLQIEEEYFGSLPFKESAIYSLFISFFITLGRSSMDADCIFPNLTPSKQYEYMEKFMSVCNHINDHCTEEITVDDLADLAGFSKFHFCRLFKQFTNSSWHDYLISKRIAYAEKLLIDPHISITDVATQSGFNSISSFNRIFKEYKK